ncbi:MAG: multidrug effflux MFS transporter [Rhodospirillales bacterium]
MATPKPAPGRPAFLRSVIVLGLTACLGPVSIDMYLPAFPSIAKDLDASIGAVQVTLILYFAGVGASQIFYGPISDQTGRKPPLYAGLAIFALGSLGCALAPTVEWLMAARLIQGLGGGVLMVIPRAVIRDMHTGVDALRLMGFIIMVTGVSPMLAPLGGVGFMALEGWRAIFAFTLGASLLAFVLFRFGYPETLAPENRRPFNVRGFFEGCAFLLADRKFTGMTFIGGFCLASFFIFVANGSFVYTNEHRLTPPQFGLAFAFNGLGFFISAQCAGAVGRRIGLEPMVKTAVTVYVIVLLTLLGLTMAGLGGLYVTIGFLFLGAACMGLTVPTVIVMAIDDHGDRAGLASSLGGALQMMTGAGMIALTARFMDGTTAPMAAAMAFAAVCALVLTLWTAARPTPAA